ncbi:MAG: 30S ribosomal protein S6, partial [Planctomycetota bacterium]|nr:30S ribosomal protein S6 [Planctomycetota bacterium]
MAQTVYECMFIYDSNRYAKDPGGISKLADDLIAKHGGEVLVSRLWNEQRLAYPIDGHRKGTYWFTYFSMPGGNLTEFNRDCEISEDILRHLAIKIDGRLVETLVAHASGTAVEAPAEGAEAAKEESAS